MSDVDVDDALPAPKMPKVRTPNTFSGQRGELKKFLMQCDVYFQLREAEFDTETDRVLFAAGLMRGTAAEWIEPTIQDYLDHPVAQQQSQTRTMVTDYGALKQQLINMFGDPSEERRAATTLMGLRQDKAVTAYAARFRQSLARTGWDERHALLQYYQGLKDPIKDQLIYRGLKPATLQEMILVIQEIDDRI